VLRIHYAETLRGWRSNYSPNAKSFIRLFEEDPAAPTGSFGCEASFRSYGLAVFQIHLIKNIDAVPLTRGYMCENKGERTSNWKIIAAAE